MKDVQNLRHTLWRTRTEIIGQPPSTLDEAIQILLEPQATFKSYKGEPLLYVEEEGKIVILTCRRNLVLLNHPQISIYADGTFAYRPDHFAQLYTIHSYQNGLYAPMVFSFLPDKSQVTYERMWKFLRHISFSMNIDLNIQNIRFDFERGAQNAVQIEFPGCVVRGCRFHLGQSWYRKLNTDLPLLRNEYIANTPTGLWLKRFFGLPFIAPEEVFDTFFELIADVLLWNLRTICTKITSRITPYFHQTCGLHDHRRFGTQPTGLKLFMQILINSSTISDPPSVMYCKS